MQLQAAPFSAFDTATVHLPTLLVLRPEQSLLLLAVLQQGEFLSFSSCIPWKCLVACGLLRPVSISQHPDDLSHRIIRCRLFRSGGTRSSRPLLKFVLRSEMVSSRSFTCHTCIMIYAGV